MKLIKPLFILFALVLPTILSSSANALSAQQILKKSDDIRNPGIPFSTVVSITEYNKAKQVDKIVVKVHSKAHPKNKKFRTLVKFLQPIKDQGKLMLKNGNEIWFYDPAASNSIRLSPQQRLLGQSSNGDVMTVNFALDYHVKPLGIEMIKDANKKPHQTYHLKMQQKNNNVTYATADYWVDTTNFHPVKAKFYSASGRLMKIAYYRRFKQNLDGLRPTEVLIIDGIDPKKITRMQFSKYKAVTIPEAWFQRGYLPRFKG